MPSTLCTVLTGLLIAARLGSAVELRAEISMAGLRGDVLFSQADPGDPIDVTFNLEGIPLGSTFYWTIQEFPVQYDIADRCGALGPSLYDQLSGTVTDQTQVRNVTISSPGVNLQGSSSLLGRSLLIEDRQEPPRAACATILPSDSITTAIVRFQSTLGGTVILRQQADLETAETMVFVHLLHLHNTSVVGGVGWSIMTGSVDENAIGSTACEGLGTVFNPMGTDNENCSTENHSNCPVGNLTAKLDKPNVGFEDAAYKTFHIDANLPLSGENSVVGKAMVFLDPTGEIITCANIKAVRSKKAVAYFSSEGVSGKMHFKQESSFDPTVVEVDLSGLKEEAGYYRIHGLPVPQLIDTKGSFCIGESLGPVWNPFQQDGSGSPNDGSGTSDQYAVGDLSGKYGMLTNLTDLQMNFTDTHLPLFGRNSIVGRSIVIQKSDGSRWACANIIDSSMMVRTAVVTFKYPVIGSIYFQQRADDPMADTSILVDLNYGDGSSASVDHNWHVHVEPIGEDFNAELAMRCKSVKGHYNPLNVPLDSGAYSKACRPDNPFPCEVGDLVMKHSQLAIRTSDGLGMKYFFTDTTLPLSGPHSIIGRSIVIHGKDSGGSRLACANIYEIKMKEVAVTEWSSGPVSGSIKLHQAPMCSHTMVMVDVKGLMATAGGYHVHDLPIMNGADNPCSGASVGGHFNPFMVNISESPPAGQGTMDEYEVGDTSGKFGRLTGLQMKKGNYMDTSLSLHGLQSIVGRSVVIHKEDQNARWVCGNIVETSASIESGMTYRAKATFKGTIQGYIMLTQVHYANGRLGDTQVYIDLSYPVNPSKKTMQHNWHIHEKPVAVGEGCGSAGPHYNPYHVDVQSNYTECSGLNPLRCEVGDQAKKLEPYDIGGGARFYTDVDIPLADEFSVMGRSFVIHAENKGAPRIACADIFPMDAATLEMTFENPKPLDKLHFVKTISSLIQTPTWTVAVDTKDSNVVTNVCLTVKTYITGPQATAMKNKLNMYLVNEPDRLGLYKPCAASGSALCLSLALLIFAVSLQKWLTD